MIGSRRIVTTERATLRPLGIQGQEVVRSYSQLRRLLSGRLSARHAALLAEPVLDSRGDHIDWYSTTEGEPRRLDALPEDERGRWMAEFEKLGGDISRLAEEYRAAKDPDRQVIGRLLDLALSYPEAADLYVIGDQPVITCWGHGAGDPGRMPETLTRRRISPERTTSLHEERVISAALPDQVGATSIAAVGRQRGRFGWWHFLGCLLLGIVLMTAALGLPPALAFLGLGPNIWLIATPAGGQADDAYEAAHQRERALRLRLAELTAAVGAGRASCPPVQQGSAR